MGHLDLIPFIARGVNIYFPILIVLLSAATWFRLGTKLLHNIGVEQFIADDAITADAIRNGKALVSLGMNFLIACY
jgi:hypothetical protein